MKDVAIVAGLLMAVFSASAESVVDNPARFGVSESTAVVFRDNGKGLRNPGMGWVHYVYGNRLWAYGAHLKADDVIEEFPGLSTVYFKLNWSDLEPEEGVFRWDIVDSYAASWTAKGFKIAFRVSCCDHRQPYATPKWVYDAGAKGFRFTIWSKTYPDPNGTGMEPLKYSDPVFLAKLEDFVRRFAARYDGREEVAWVEVSSFGLWGEGHTIGTSHLAKEETAEIAKRHIALWKRHFRRTQLVMSDDVSCDFERCGAYPIMDYAAEQGIGLRDDSIFCVKRQPPWLHDDMAQRFWPTLPVILEHEHWAISKAQGNWDPEILPRAVEEYHASYLSAHWFPREYLEQNRALIDRINARMGYRLLPREVRYPPRVRIGERCTIESDWSNLGVAPCRERPVLAWTLKDETGAVRWIWSDESFEAAALPVAAPGQAERRTHVTMAVFGNAATFSRDSDGLYRAMVREKVLPDFLKGTTRVPTVESGRYTLWLSLGRYDGQPQIALPIDGDDGSRRYRVGEIEILPAAAQARRP